MKDLYVTETKDENVDKLCDVLGYAYSVVEPGEVVIPQNSKLFRVIFLIRDYLS